MNVKQEMKQLTYVVEYSPNCPSPFLVRLSGPGKGLIDKLPYSRVAVTGGSDLKLTQDVLGFGKSFQEAASVALKKLEQMRREKLLSARDNVYRTMGRKVPRRRRKRA